MKKFLIFLLPILIAGVLSYPFLTKEKKPVTMPVIETDLSVPEIKAYQQMEQAPIKWTEVQTTAELEDLFKDVQYDKMPRVFVRRFPADFAQKGSPALMATVLLPHILRQNELLLAERAAFLALADKLKNNQPFTQKEEEFWTNLIYKYEVLNPDKIGQQEFLYRRIDRISPSLAVAQSIEATQNAKIHLNSPFDVRRWNDKKVYDFVVYDDLASAVADYALELNRGYSYLKFHMLRSAQRPSRTPLKGKIFARGLTYYKLEDVAYLQKLQEIFKWYQFEKLDEAQFERKN